MLGVCLAWVLGCFHLNLSEGADRVGGQLRGDKECPFSGVTSSGRVWRKVPESDAGSVGQTARNRLGLPVAQGTASFQMVFFASVQNTAAHTRNKGKKLIMMLFKGGRLEISLSSLSFIIHSTYRPY